MLENISKIYTYRKPLTAVIFWGISFIATKYALAETKPLVIILIRQLLGFMLLSSIALYQKKSFAINLKDHKWIILLSGIASLHLYIQVTGLQYTSASNTGWIIGITPVFMVLLAFVFFKERITITQITGITVAFFGLLLLVSRGNLLSIDLISNKGDFLVLLSSFTWAVYSLVGKKTTINYPPLMTILYLFAMMSLYLIPFTLNRSNISSIVSLSITAWISLLFLGLFCSGIAYVLWAQSLNEMPATKVGAFLYIEPFITVFTAWVLLNEEISLLTFVSGLVIIIGVVIVNRK